MAGEEKEKVRIVSGPTTAELAKGKVGEETLEQLAGGELLTREEITEAVEESGGDLAGADSQLTPDELVLARKVTGEIKKE